MKRKSDFLAWVLIIFGIVLVCLFCLLLCLNNLAWFQGQFSLENTGHAGAFVGGTAGALWALAGVLFFRSALMLQREELEQQRKAFEQQREASNASIAWSIFYQNLKSLERLQATKGYQKALSAILRDTLFDLSSSSGGGPLSEGKEKIRFKVTDDDTENMSQFRQKFDISIYNTDKDKNVFRMLKAVDIISKIILRYDDNNQLLVSTLFSHLSDCEARIIIYKCIVDKDYFARSEKIGFFNHFFSHAFRNTIHAEKFFPDYKFDEGYLVRKISN